MASGKWVQRYKGNKRKMRGKRKKVYLIYCNFIVKNTSSQRYKCLLKETLKKKACLQTILS